MSKSQVLPSHREVGSLSNVVNFVAKNAVTSNLFQTQIADQYAPSWGQNKQDDESSSKASKKPGYNSHAAMKQRCNNPKHKDYPNYGGRGIGYDPSWEAYDQFIVDMGLPPFAEATLDRIDGDADYGPSNCRWADKTEQARNRRTNRLLTHDRKTYPLAQWAALYEMSAATLSERLKAGWSMDDALLTPVKQGGDRKSKDARVGRRDKGGAWPPSMQDVEIIEKQYQARRPAFAELSRAEFYLAGTANESERFAEDYSGSDPDEICPETLARMTRIEMLRAEARGLVAIQKARRSGS